MKDKIILAICVCLMALIGWGSYFLFKAVLNGTIDTAKPGATVESTNESSEAGNSETATLSAEELAAQEAEAVKSRAASHIYSHRGNSPGQVEETLQAYDKVIELGSVNIEQDVVSSKDGTLYVSHDLTAGRLTGVERYFSDMTDEEINQLRTSDGQQIPRLSDVFDRYGKKVSYIVEIKALEQTAADKFIQLVHQYGYERQVVVQCFSLDILKHIEAEIPEMQKLFLCKTTSEFEAGLNADFVDIISVEKSLMTRDNCELTHQVEKLFSAWTLDSEAEITDAIEKGVDVYFTNNSELALELELKLQEERKKK